VKTCPDCKGTGYIKKIRIAPYGRRFEHLEPCPNPKCKAGKVVKY
jgi:DnaJ-class molecular chaperone